MASLRAASLRSCSIRCKSPDPGVINDPAHRSARGANGLTPVAMEMDGVEGRIKGGREGERTGREKRWKGKRGDCVREVMPEAVSL